MKRLVMAFIVLVALCLLIAEPVDARYRERGWHRHSHGRHWPSLTWGYYDCYRNIWGELKCYDPWLGWYYPYRYSPPPVVIPSPPPVVIQPAPPTTYTEKPPEQKQTEQYLSYCKEEDKFYPEVGKCPSEWLKVISSPVPEKAGEYWKFCRGQWFSPYTKECPSGWLYVIPETTPPDLPK